MKNIKGSAILVVVMVLMVVSIITTAAARLSMSSLQQSSIGQAKRVLENENDVALRFIFGDTPTTAMKAATGIFGFTKAKTGKEVIWCMPAKISTASTFFVSTKTSTGEFTTGNSPNMTAGGTTGFCKASKEDNYTSVRKNIMTQIALFKETAKTATGVTGGSLTTGDVYTATVTSFLPKMTTATEAQMDACLSSKMNNMNYITHSGGNATARQTVGKCLKDLGVPVYVTTATYVVQ